MHWYRSPPYHTQTSSDLPRWTSEWIQPSGTMFGQWGRDISKHRLWFHFNSGVGRQQNTCISRCTRVNGCSGQPQRSVATIYYSRNGICTDLHWSALLSADPFTLQMQMVQSRHWEASRSISFHSMYTLLHTRWPASARSTDCAKSTYAPKNYEVTRRGSHFPEWIPWGCAKYFRLFELLINLNLNSLRRRDPWMQTMSCIMEDHPVISK